MEIFKIILENILIGSIVTILSAYLTIIIFEILSTKKHKNNRKIIKC